jgi:amino-acid N-acetyltransferase
MIDLLPVRPVTPRDPDWQVFSDLLALASLPQPEEGGRSFAVEDDRGLLGFGAIEGGGSDQLLRSVVLVPSLRRRGLGHALVSQLVGQARADGAARLWLLTTGAERWFARLAGRPCRATGRPRRSGG